MEKVNSSKLLGVEERYDYSRTQIPQNRWSDTWNTVKANFSSVVIINVLTLLFLLPSFVVLYIGNVYTLSLGAVYPFASNAGLGYFVFPDTVGLIESVYLSSDLIFYSLLAASGIIAALGIAGGAYSIRRLLNTNGDFKIRYFFHGIRLNYLATLIPTVIFMAVFFGCVLVGDWSELFIAQGGNAFGAITARVVTIVITVFVGMICAWSISLGASYKINIVNTVKNSFKLFLNTVIQSVFIAALALVPLWLFLLFAGNSFMNMLVILAIFFIGISFILIFWMAFSQWVFDIFITPEISAKKEVKPVKTAKQIAQEEEEERKRVALELLAAGKSELIGRPIMPISGETNFKGVGVAYSRADIARIAAERKNLSQDLNAYYEEHKNDPKYAEYNKMFADREKPVQDNSKKGKKKIISSDNLLR